MSEGHDTRPLLVRAAAGLAWVFTSMMAGRVITLASTAVLARLLSPSDFGVMAVPLLVITYLETVGDLGTGAALVQVQENRDEAALVTLGFNLLMGAGWFAAMWLLADPVAAFFDRADTGPAMEALAWVFAIKALGNTHESLLLHDLDFRSRATPEIGRAAVKAVVSIVLALRGMGAWSLVWGQIVGTAAWVLLTWRAVPWVPWRHLGTGSLQRALSTVRPMLSFGSQVVLVNILAVVLHHVDQPIVGKVAGVTALGLYSMASKLPEACITTLTWTVGKVAFPAFARSSGDLAARRSVYLTALRFISALTLPTAILLSLLARPALVAFFGRQWGDAAGMLSWLALGAAFRAVGSHAGDLFKGAGRADLLRNLGLAKACITLPALALAGTTGDAETIAFALAAATLITSGTNVWVARSLLDLRWREMLREMAPGLGAAAAVACTVAPLGLLTASWPTTLDAAVRGAAGVAVGLGTLWALSPDARGLVRRVLRRGRTDAPPPGAP